MSAVDKIIGYELIKEELKQIADCLKLTDKYRRMGVSIPRGLLLEGKPGVGKTLMTTCLVEGSGRIAFICRKDSSDGSFIKHIREIFEQAEENALSVVVLDDMDKFAVIGTAVNRPTTIISASNTLMGFLIFSWIFLLCFLFLLNRDLSISENIISSRGKEFLKVPFMYPPPLKHRRKLFFFCIIFSLQ